jgi:undecaprenyl pyrophosphate phosphatase UppP
VAAPACAAVSDPTSGEPKCPYHRPVANVGIAAVVILSIGGLIALLLRIAPGQHRQSTRALIGLVPGLVGTLIVGALAMDFVPDQLETVALPWVIVVVTGGLILLMVKNLLER